MTAALTIFTAAVVGASCGNLMAELPRYSLTRTADFFPQLGSAGDPLFPNRTIINSVSGGGRNYLATFADFEHPVSPPGSQITTPAETNYIIDADTLSITNTSAPPAGYVTGTSGAVRSGSAGHIVFSVSGADDRNTPGWLDRIQVGRTNPDGTTTVLPGGSGIEQRGVNSDGTVIGVGPNDFTAWRYSDANSWQSLGSLNPSGYAHPRGINDNGMIIGRTADATGNHIPFYYTESGGMQAITEQGNAVYGEAVAISNTGLVTGTANGRAFIFNAETMEFRYVTESITGWQGRDINDAGAIIGSNGLAGTVILGVPSGSAFYWNDALSAATSLENLIGDEIDNWFITDAVDINDYGWILGTGFRRSDNTFHQVLLRPIPEPGVVAFLTAGVAASLRRRRR